MGECIGEVAIDGEGDISWSKASLAGAKWSPLHLHCFLLQLKLLSVELESVAAFDHLKF